MKEPKATTRPLPGTTGGGIRRWLAQTIRYNMQVTTFRRIPFNWLPAGLAFSVYFIAQPRD